MLTRVELLAGAPADWRARAASWYEPVGAGGAVASPGGRAGGDRPRPHGRTACGELARGPDAHPARARRFRHDTGVRPQCEGTPGGSSTTSAPVRPSPTPWGPWAPRAPRVLVRPAGLAARHHPRFPRVRDPERPVLAVPEDGDRALPLRPAHRDRRGGTAASSTSSSLRAASDRVRPRPAVRACGLRGAFAPDPAGNGARPTPGTGPVPHSSDVEPDDLPRHDPDDQPYHLVRFGRRLLTEVLLREPAGRSLSGSPMSSAVPRMPTERWGFAASNSVRLMRGSRARDHGGPRRTVPIECGDGGEVLPVEQFARFLVDLHGHNCLFLRASWLSRPRRTPTRPTSFPSTW